MKNIKLYRFFCGGVWYRHEMTGELPGCYGSWWSRKYDHHPRYEAITEIEAYVHIILPQL